MEKCSFCVQRIQDVRMRAKSEGRAVKDGEVRPACAVACPAEAIAFGDLNDPGSAVARLAKSRRGYHLLEEFGAKPVITYLSRVTNPAGVGDAGKGPAAKGGSA
jgi:molybdopterin-containing oxidoreductase family iron-sulfur binding subunit